MREWGEVAENLECQAEFKQWETVVGLGEDRMTVL